MGPKDFWDRWMKALGMGCSGGAEQPFRTPLYLAGHNFPPWTSQRLGFFLSGSLGDTGESHAFLFL
jgi:hypothetical protein